MNLHPHAPCHTLLQYQSNSKNWSRMIDHSSGEFCNYFICSTFSFKMSVPEMLPYATPPSMNLQPYSPYRALLGHQSTSGKMKQDDWPLQWWVLQFFYVLNFLIGNGHPWPSVLCHAPSTPLNLQPHTPCCTLAWHLEDKDAVGGARVGTALGYYEGFEVDTLYDTWERMWDFLLWLWITVQNSQTPQLR